MNTFEELDLIEPIRRALRDENYEVPTPIQAQTIPPAIDGSDVLGCAQTGTGKTAAFALPILNYLGEEYRKALPNRPDALVLAPTRELAIQIGQSFNTYGKYLKLTTALVYGGVNQSSQVKAMSRGAHILVATPGRLLDLMEQRFIKLDKLEIFVLDEADRMMDMGFMPDLKKIISKLPEQRQSLFFSATLPPNIVELSQRLLYNPVSVSVTPKQTTVERIEQRVMHLDKTDKLSALRKILADAPNPQAIVFTRTKRGANALAEKLSRGEFKAAAIHGNKSQGARQRALADFRNYKVQVLVATDVAARGIDIDGVTHVINFDMPTEPESYVHRIGRTGRAGAAGIAYSFCTAMERDELRAIERLIGQQITVEGEPPAGPDQRPAKRGASQGRTRSQRHSISKQPRSASRSGGASPVSAKPKSNRRRKPSAKPAESRA